MANRNPNTSWNGTARSLHWLMALLIGLQAAAGWVGHEMERSPLKVDVLTAHKSLGVTLLMLVVVRLLWRWTHPPPPTAPWQRPLAGMGGATDPHRAVPADDCIAAVRLAGGFDFHRPLETLVAHPLA